MHELKAGLNADKFATFWMLPKSFYHSFILQMTFTTSSPGSSRFPTWRQQERRHESFSFVRKGNSFPEFRVH